MKDKGATEGKSSGISPEPRDKDKALSDLNGTFREADEEHREIAQKRKLKLKTT